MWGQYPVAKESMGSTEGYAVRRWKVKVVPLFRILWASMALP